MDPTEQIRPRQPSRSPRRRPPFSTERSRQPPPTRASGPHPQFSRADDAPADRPAGSNSSIGSPAIHRPRRACAFLARCLQKVVAHGSSEIRSAQSRPSTSNCSLSASGQHRRIAPRDDREVCFTFSSRLSWEAAKPSGQMRFIVKTIWVVYGILTRNASSSVTQQLRVGSLTGCECQILVLPIDRPVPATRRPTRDLEN